MILIPRDALVDTMHEALARPELDDFEYGCFMSGPSKTADIEQALVFGAHGPMSITSYCGKPHLSTPRPLSGTFSQVPDSSLYDSSVSSVKISLADKYPHFKNIPNKYLIFIRE